LISESDIDAYKKENIKLILENLDKQRKKDGNESVTDLTEADLEYTEEETFDE